VRVCTPRPLHGVWAACLFIIITYVAFIVTRELARDAGRDEVFYLSKTLSLRSNWLPRRSKSAKVGQLFNFALVLGHWPLR